MLGRPNEALPSSSCSESDITRSAKLLDKIRQAQTQYFGVEAEKNLSVSSGNRFGRLFKVPTPETEMDD